MTIKIYNAGIDWQFLIIQGGGMARKSDLDAWLMARFGINEIDARDVSNTIEFRNERFYMISSGAVEWYERNAGRPAPLLEQYGGWDAITMGGKIGLI